MSNDAIIIRKVQALGIPDPMRASAETLRVVLQAYFTRKVLNEDTFRGYMGMLNPSLQILMEGLKAFSLDQSGLSHKVLDHIDVAMGVLKTRLDRPDITPQEAREIRGRSSISCARRARKPMSNASSPWGWRRLRPRRWSRWRGASWPRWRIAGACPAGRQ